MQRDDGAKVMRHAEWGEYVVLTVRGADERKGDPGMVEEGWCLTIADRLEVRDARGTVLKSEPLEPGQDAMARARQILGAKREEKRDWFGMPLPNRKVPY
jgi:hypothetical protein